MAGHYVTVSATSLVYTLVVFLIGAVAMRGAGCIINDLWDKNIDMQVERTAGRPLAAGTLKTMQAVYLLLALLFLGFVILITLGEMTIILGLLTIPMIISYPLFKRVTYWPQAMLGLTFNFGALMGWTAITGELSWAAFALYIGCLFWTIGYDTVYAHQDKEDDVLVGVKSTALKFGDNSKRWVGGLYAAAFTCILGALYLADMGVPTYLGALVIAAHLAWQVKYWEPDNASSSLKTFKSNRDLGAIVLVIILLGYA